MSITIKSKFTNRLFLGRAKRCTYTYVNTIITLYAISKYFERVSLYLYYVYLHGVTQLRAAETEDVKDGGEKYKEEMNRS